MMQFERLHFGLCVSHESLYGDDNRFDTIPMRKALVNKSTKHVDI